MNLKYYYRQARSLIKQCISYLVFNYHASINKAPKKINLCSGVQKIPGYFNLDYDGDVDLKIDLRSRNLPFKDSSVEVLVCISAINYFSYKRAGEIIQETYRVLEVGGITRYAVQDLDLLTLHYVNRDKAFFFQKNSNGSADRFSGETFSDKYVNWFYGYQTQGGSAGYFYSFESLSLLFHKAGFSNVRLSKPMESGIENIHLIDNRVDQMFFLEAVK